MRDCQICTTFLKDCVAVEYGSGILSGSGRVDLDNTLNRDRVDREAIGYGSNRGRVDRVLIGIFFLSHQTRSLHDRFRSTRPLLNQHPIIYLWLLERLASRSLLEFVLTSPKFSGRKPERCQAS